MKIIEYTPKFMIVALVVMVALIMLSCDHHQQAAQKQTEAGRILQAAYEARDYERMIALCDSLEQTGDISKIRAASTRGSVNNQLGKNKLAEDEHKKALAETPKNEIDSLQFYRSAVELSSLYSVSGNYEGVLQLALPKIAELKVWAEKKPSDDTFHLLMDLTTLVGSTQLRLGMKKEAEKMFEQCVSYIQKSSSQTHARISNKADALFTIIISFTNVKNYTTAEKFLPQLDSLASAITAVQDSTDEEWVGQVLAEKWVDQVLAEDYVAHTIIHTGLNRPKEAARYLALYQNTQESKTLWGRMTVGELLLEMKRYAEAADAYALLDSFYAQSNIELSLDNLDQYCFKFKANYKAGRRDTALAVAAYVFENLDSVITKQKNSDAAELATVYETQQKDAEIAQQQISLSRQRWISTLVALVLLTTFFIIYTWYRRRAENRLGAAHVELQQAYDQLEETTAAKERIESELRIARDIQMSMVPGIFPQHEGLDMYAEMNPAKEVGGDLYGYVMQGDRLYFCVGDVSGKGVPASLFMAQSARLFRTLATEGMMPADIAVRMNNELTEGNDKGMFVTMFMGLLHLDTGRLDYCNCGHNAPIIDGQFLKMQYDNQPLGLWEDDPFEGETIDDIRGRQLLIYTDGLNEAENQQKQHLGNKRLQELMADSQNLDSHQVIDMLKSAVEQHRNGAEPNDDLTLMCITLNIKD